MVLIRRCNCNYDQCQATVDVKKVHVGDECVHNFGTSHKLINN